MGHIAGRGAEDAAGAPELRGGATKPGRSDRSPRSRLRALWLTWAGSAAVVALVLWTLALTAWGRPPGARASLRQLFEVDWRHARRGPRWLHRREDRLSGAAPP